MNDRNHPAYAWNYPVVLIDDGKRKCIYFHQQNGGWSFHNCDQKMVGHRFQPARIQALKDKIRLVSPLEEGDTEEQLLRRCAVLYHLADCRNRTCEFNLNDNNLSCNFTFRSKQGRFYKSLIHRLREEGIYYEIHDKLHTLNPDTDEVNPRRLGVRIVIDITAHSDNW